MKLVLLNGAFPPGVRYRIYDHAGWVHGSYLDLVGTGHPREHHNFHDIGFNDVASSS